MKQIMVLCFFLLLVPQCMSQYEFFKIVEQWPPTACKLAACSPTLKKPQNFTVHGLYPTNTTTTPTRCNPINGFNINLVKSLFPRINISWPNLKGAEETFWEHEWQDHGSCSQMDFGVLQYFTLALDIKDRLYLLDELKKENVLPDSKKPYEYDDVAKVIVKAIGTKPELRCVHKEGQNYLNEVGLCLDHNGKDYKDCPAPKKSDVGAARCKKKFLFLPL